MDNNELLAQVVNLLKEQTETMSNYIDQRVGKAERQIELKIENDVTKRIDALFDGYKLTHEKQWELERKTDTMQAQLENLHLRLLAIENKTA